MASLAGINSATANAAFGRRFAFFVVGILTTSTYCVYAVGASNVFRLDLRNFCSARAFAVRGQDLKT